MILLIGFHYNHDLFPNDPSKIPNNVSHTLLHYFVEMGPCQPSSFDLLNNVYPKSKDSAGLSRSFHQSYFYKSLSNGTSINRSWLSYSPLLDKIYCTTCKLFGLAKVKNSKFVSNGSNDWKNLKRTIENHESSIDHIQAEISRGLYTKNARLDITLLQSANSHVASNREIVRAVIEVLIYCARQNVSLRGHDEKITSHNQGNFLELMKLISKYHPSVNTHLDKINKMTKGNRLTFLSNRSQNNLLKIIGETIRTKILAEVKKSELFSVIIDTTTDVSNQEQFSFILRYVNDNGVIEERLAALETAVDGTGLGLFQAFKNITDKYNINWREDLCAQSYDGAAAMQGEYSGLRTLIQKENPRALYIWCFAHQLNLVIVDTCDCCQDTRNFFGEVQSLVAYMRARKRTAVFIKFQKELEPNERIRRMKYFSETRWSSHGRVIEVIYFKYKALLKTLDILKESSDRVTASMAKSLMMTVTTFEFVLSMILLKKIFNITTPLSNYLQSKSLDFIQALKLVDLCKKKLTDMRSEEECNLIIDEAKTFIKTYVSNGNALQSNDFKSVRTKKKKKMADENTHDEISDSPLQRYRCNTFYKVLDQIIGSINSRFSDARKILKDLSLLSPERILLYSKLKDPLPVDSFKYISDWVKNINTESLRTEYIQFSTSLTELLSGIKLTTHLHDEDYTSNINQLYQTDISSDDDDEEISNISINEKTENNINIETILHVLSSYTLVAAFPNLYKAFKALGTIPASSSSAERSFSKVY